MKPSLLPGLLLGLVLGAACLWLVPRSLGPDAPGSFAPTADRDALDVSPALSGAHPPPPLSPAHARAAIAAWIALGTSDDTAPPADFFTRAASLRALLVRLPASEFARLHQNLLPLADRDSRQLLAAAFAVWTEQNPAAAADWAARAPAFGGFDPLELARSAALAWAARDPFAAAEWACALPDPARSLALAELLLPRLAERDPARALALATARGEAVFERLPGIFRNLARQDPAAAFAAHGDRLWNKGEGFRRNLEFRAALADWIGRAPAEAIAWIRSHDDPDIRGTVGWVQMLAIDGIVAPGLLASALATAPGIPARQAALSEVLANWHTRDATAAQAWLDDLPDTHLRSALIEQTAIRDLGQPRLNLPFALALPSGPLRRERFSSLLAGWAKTDPSAALAWSQAHAGDPDVGAAAPKIHAAILGTIARDEPVTALAEWKALPEGPAKTEAVSTIGEAWGRHDPTAAFTWMAEQDALAGRNGHPDIPRFLTFYAWSRQQPLAALRWAEQPKETPLVTEGYLLALSGAGTNTEGPPLSDTVRLYAQIADPALRGKLLPRYARRWLAADPAAARAWIEKSEALTTEQRAALLAAP